MPTASKLAAHETVTEVGPLATAATFWGTLGAWVSGGPDVPVVKMTSSNANLAPAPPAGFSSTLTVRESPDVLIV